MKEKVKIKVSKNNLLDILIKHGLSLNFTPAAKKKWAAGHVILNPGKTQNYVKKEFLAFADDPIEAVQLALELSNYALAVSFSKINDYDY